MVSPAAAAFPPPPRHPPIEPIKPAVPPQLRPAETRLSFPPLYCLVGLSRLLTDRSIRQAVWAKAKHGTLRGVLLGTAWVVVSYRFQLAAVQWLTAGSGGFGFNWIRKYTPGDGDTIFGVSSPFSLSLQGVAEAPQDGWLLREHASRLSLALTSDPSRRLIDNHSPLRS